MQPRDYQQIAVDATWRYLQTHDGNPCIVMPTGSGKSACIAMLASEVAKWGGRLCVLAHVKELLTQNAEKIRLFTDVPVGIYSAGLKSRDASQPITVAGIQSIYDRTDFDPFDLIVIDECHLIPVDGDGRYRTFLATCAAKRDTMRIVGLTATPYRTGTGWLCGPQNILNEVCYEIGIRKLIDAGYLSDLRWKQPMECDTSRLHVRGGEFVEAEVDVLMQRNTVPACRELVALTADRKSVLVFCCSVAHAENVVDILRQTQDKEVELVTGKTLDFNRQHAIDGLKDGSVKYVVNVNVLSTGFDAPNIDCVAVLRPTLSPGLWYQMVGRGLRISEFKQNCLILDFGGNTRRHGPINRIQPSGEKRSAAKPREKEDLAEKVMVLCPRCLEWNDKGTLNCVGCGIEMVVAVPPKHDAKADTSPVLEEKDKPEPIYETVDVLDVKYTIHYKKNAPPEHPPTLRATYKIGQWQTVSEWVCIEHEGYARIKAVKWWKARSDDNCPLTIVQALDAIDGGCLAVPLQLELKHEHGVKWPNINKVFCGPKPERVATDWSNLENFDFTTPSTDGSFAGFASDDMPDRQYPEASDDVPF